MFLSTAVARGLGFEDEDKLLIISFVLQIKD